MNKGRILLAHGAGGKLSETLMEEVFLPAFTNPMLAPLSDQAILDPPNSRLAFTTDSFVVKPMFFPGGDIGKLSVCGTVNDLAVGGARPLYLSAAFIIEEGTGIDELSRIVDSMGATAREAGVSIVTGDTKVVERGKGDGVFINTAGIGVVPEGCELSPERIGVGDAVIISGTVGDHSIAIMAQREGIRMEVSVESDCAPLYPLISDILATGAEVKAMRDPTRGGLATVLCEMAASSATTVLIKEEAVPVRDDVRGATELLGFDPLYLANEGKVVVFVKKKDAALVLDAMRRNRLGRNAAVIGEVIGGKVKGRVLLETTIGSRRIIEKLSGEQLPRIC